MLMVKIIIKNASIEKTVVCKPKCIECGKTLVAVGNARSNGKPHNDWGSRKLHKKCWRLFYA